MKRVITCAMYLCLIEAQINVIARSRAHIESIQVRGKTLRGGYYNVVTRESWGLEVKVNTLRIQHIQLKDVLSIGTDPILCNPNYPTLYVSPQTSRLCTFFSH